MFHGDPRSVKERIREGVWEALEKSGEAIFPLPARGRVPNFRGSDAAALRLRELKEYRSAKTVMVNPDAAQLPVRRMCLMDGKKVLMATPRLRRGFFIIDPARTGNAGGCATIAGALRHGAAADLRRTKVDLIVEGSVAVDACGGRVGKGSGWGDLEYAVLRESGAASEDVKVVTTVHDLQVTDDPIPMEPHDMPVDIILTPTRTITAKPTHPKPQGIAWGKLGREKLELVRKILGAASCVKRE